MTALDRYLAKVQQHQAVQEARRRRLWNEVCRWWEQCARAEGRDPATEGSALRPDNPYLPQYHAALATYLTAHAQ